MGQFGVGANIGYLRGSPGELLLSQAGRLSQAEAVGSEALNAKKLCAGRTNVWIANRKLAELAWSSMGGKPEELRFGPVILELRMYLAAAGSSRLLRPPNGARPMTRCASMALHHAGANFSVTTIESPA